MPLTSSTKLSFHHRPNHLDQLSEKLRSVWYIIGDESILAFPCPGGLQYLTGVKSGHNFQEAVSTECSNLHSSHASNESGICMYTVIPEGSVTVFCVKTSMIPPVSLCSCYLIFPRFFLSRPLQRNLVHK